MITSSHKAGDALARALRAGPSRSELASQRDRVISAMQLAVPERRTFFRPLLALAVAGALLAFAVHELGVGSEFSASVDGQRLQESATIQGQAAAPKLVDFSDGSRLSLQPQARIELAQLSNERASINLTQGRVDASIRKGTGRAWTISAGPYTVRVTGTKFTVHWDDRDQAFSVTVREGQVLVFGEDLPLTGLPLEAGAHFERRARAPREDSRTRKQAAAPRRDGVAASPPTQPEPAARANAEPSWEKLAGQAQYKRALELAQKAGFERLTQELPENELLLLANTARYAGDSKSARIALLKLRERFPGRTAAALAAMYLARIAEDHAKNPAEAATWLSMFLNESPRGELAAGARARLLAILLRQGNHARARQVALDYLRYHPDGPHAAQARSAAESPSP